MRRLAGDQVQSWLRRGTVFGATAVLTALAGSQLHGILTANGLSPLEAGLLAIFHISFAWIAFSFCSAVAGFATLWSGWRGPGLVYPTAADRQAPLDGRTALLVPIHNEEPGRVFANLQAIHDSLAATGRLDSFDVFVLSDTTDPDVWVAEELEWHALQDRLTPGAPVYYRRRRHNVGRKSGNVADFCRRWGHRYDHFVVLDADSLMDGATLTEMVLLMQRNPQVGLIQSPPSLVNAETLFARAHQFANRLYGPIVSAGLGFWQLGDGNYWGHNAIIRTRAFTESCGLPALEGQPPFGGPIMSHDFVEAALLRRSGWQVRLLHELAGSYEECPPTLVDYAKRDRRWCQGNLQHMRVVAAGGLHPISRLHLLMGIMAYLSSPIWLAFLVIGLLSAIEAAFTPLHYFPNHPSLFPDWPSSDPEAARNLLIIAMGMLLAPKALGLLLAFRAPAALRGFGGPLRLTVGVVAETVVSALLAPVMMLLQSGFVARLLGGRDSGWAGQRRAGRASVLEVLLWHGGHSAIGLALAAIVYFASPALLVWFVPIIAGLVLAVPLSYLTGLRGLGRWVRRRGLWQTPEERRPPAVIAAAARLRDEAEPAEADARGGLDRVIENPLANALHLTLLTAKPATEDEQRSLGMALDKLGRCDMPRLADALDRAETMALLHDGETLVALHRAMLRDGRSGVQAVARQRHADLQAGTAAPAAGALPIAQAQPAVTSPA